MFLSRLIERNPALLKTAVAWHQEHRIPTNTYLIDLDTIRDNARILAAAKREHGLETYLMTKQHGRNPLVNLVALQEGLHATVNVDIQCVRINARYGVPIGHVGHLNQIPRGDMDFVLGTDPEVWTVFSIEHAEFISAAAARRGRVQDIMLRVYRDGDVFFPGQEGGFPFDGLIAAARRIMALPNVRIMGVVSFPCFRYNLTSSDLAEPSPNMATLVAAAAKLRAELGLEITQINAPGNTSSQTFPILKANGATHVEPGHGLLGTTPNHRFRDGLPERPAYCYVSEITHIYEGMGYAHGGGLFQDIYDKNFQYKALVGSDPEKALANQVTYKRVEQIIDYHAPLLEGDRCRVGDTVLMGFRSQFQMTRSWVGVVTGLSKGKPELAGLFDHAAHMLDPQSLEALPLAEARAMIQAVVAGYR
ncbi:MAG: amino acid racemase [Firmicutes bacterium]|nr:amino acid racemase [Bacillota bacterium]